VIESGQKGQNILIVGINYFPEETGNAPYTTGIAEHLALKGHRVQVVAGMPYYPSWTVDPGYQGKLRLKEQRNGVTIHRFRQYVPSKQTAIRRAGFEVSFFLNSMTATGIRRPDYILGFLPSLSDGVLCAFASKRYGVPFGLLIQDLVGQSAAQSGIQGGSRVVGITRALEGWTVRQASRIAVVAEGFRPRLVELGVDPNRIHRVRNWTHVGQARRSKDETRDDLGIPRSAIVCLHAGNMGLKQGLENVIDTARLAERTDPRLLFVLVGDGNQRAMLEEQATGLSNVCFLPPQPEELFPDVLASADILLVNQRPTVTDMSLPGKLTSYFSSGRPVVAAVAAESETRREIEAAQGGVVVPSGNPAALLEAVRQLANDPECASELGQHGRRYQEQYLTSDAALRQIDEFIAQIESSRPTDMVKA
jgi:glycosyltransferase involved in cell wall biosynthesis